MIVDFFSNFMIFYTLTFPPIFLLEHSLAPSFQINIQLLRHDIACLALTNKEIALHAILHRNAYEMWTLYYFETFQVILTPILTARPQTDELGLLVQGVDELEPI